MLNNEKKINNLFGVILLLSSTTGWYILDFIGMNKFWVAFILLSFYLSFLIIKYLYNYKDILLNNSSSNKRILKIFIKNKFSNNKFFVILIIYLLWTSFTYLLNYTGIYTLLYMGKMWFIITIYIIIASVYLFICKDKRKFLKTISKYIFILGSIHSFIAFYQLMFLNNNFLGLTITDWPSYNPASLYGNVNGLGSFLFISIISGLYLFFISKKYNKSILFLLVFQSYALYLSIARTSIVSLLVFVILSIIGVLIYNPTIFKTKISVKFLLIFILANAFIFTFVTSKNFRNNLAFILTHNEVYMSENERTAIEMFKEKNHKGVNNRQFIWKQVIKDSKEYMILGDGLKYNIVSKINVREVISEKSAGVTRISYHNTLFRYFASNGLIGLLIFLYLMAYMPISLVMVMVKNRRFDIKPFLIISFLAALFAYMQMEEIYIGEIGFMQLITLTAISFATSELSHTVEDRKQ